MSDIIKKLLNDEVNLEELQRLIVGDSRLVRGYAIMALSRWIGEHTNFLADDLLIQNLIAAALDESPYTDMPLPATYVTSRYLAIACLLDINTVETQNVVSQILEKLALPEKHQYQLEKFLQERPSIEIFTGKKIGAERKDHL